MFELLKEIHAEKHGATLVDMTEMNVSLEVIVERYVLFCEAIHTVIPHLLGSINSTLITRLSSCPLNSNPLQATV